MHTIRKLIPNVGASDGNNQRVPNPSYIQVPNIGANDDNVPRQRLPIHVTLTKIEEDIQKYLLDFINDALPNEIVSIYTLNEELEMQSFNDAIRYDAANRRYTTSPILS